MQVEDIPNDNKVITIPEETGWQVKSLQLKQRSINPIEQEESAKDPPLKHVYQDKEKKAYAHRADGGKDHDKHQSKMPKLSFDELVAKNKKEAN